MTDSVGENIYAKELPTDLADHAFYKTGVQSSFTSNVADKFEITKDTEFFAKHI